MVFYHYIYPRKAWGFLLGDDVFGVGANDFSDPNNLVYGIDSYHYLIVDVFDPNATLEFENCYSAGGKDSIAYAFKLKLPHASVWGYTIECKQIGIPGVWETGAIINPLAPWTWDDDWIEVIIPP